MKSITVIELKSMLDQGKEFQLIDVREPYEFDISNLGGELIPMGQIMQKVEKIDKTMECVVIHCRSGKRSAAVIDALQRLHGFENLYNLKGGILAYADEVDTSLTKY